MERQDWKSRADENQTEVEQLTKWVEKEAQQIEDQTARLNSERADLKDEVRQLRAQIVQLQNRQVNIDLSSSTSELQELQRIKKENKICIDKLKLQIELQREQNKGYLAKIQSDKSLSQQFDENVQTYIQLQKIQQMAEVKAKLISNLLSLVGETKLIHK